MFNESIPKEYSKRINAVVNFILENPKDELSLATLAKIANYSPFHFQKLFKQITGETPKQLIIRIRLENAAHYLLNHKNKSVTEIALDSGFASPATFARAFKNYFGIPADELRNLFPKEHIMLRQSVSLNKKRDVDFFAKEYNAQYWKKNLKIEVKKITPHRIIFMNAPLSNKKKIQEGFKKIIRIAEAHDLLTSDSKFIGILNPHAGLYQSAITIQSHQSPPKETGTIVIEGGKYATCKIKGDTHLTIHTFHALYELWLPENPYRVRQSYVFEILSQNPLMKPYNTIEREIYIPLEPA